MAIRRGVDFKGHQSGLNSSSLVVCLFVVFLEFF